MYKPHRISADNDIALARKIYVYELFGGKNPINNDEKKK